MENICIIGYEGLYKIDSDGNIISYIKDKPKVLKPSLSKNGYLVVNMFKDSKFKKFFVHRLIAIHLIDNPNNYPCVNHINSCRSDNRLENLEWCTHSQNTIHAYRLNRVPTENRKRGAESIQSKKIVMYNSDIPPQEFGSIGEAARHLGLKTIGNIQLVLAGRRNRCRGFYFKYA